MPRLRSGLLAAWTTAWFDAAVGADHVLDAVTGRDAPHEVVEGGVLGAAASGPPRTLGAALIDLRGRADAVRLVLPVPGDLRGLPAGATGFRAAALQAGEAVVCGGLGLVPAVTRHRPSSAPTHVVWQAFDLGPDDADRPLDAPADRPQLSEVAHELSAAIRETATALSAAALDARRADPGDGLDRARRAGEGLDLPPGFPSRAVAVLAQAERLTAALALAGADPLGGAVDRTGLDRRTEALAPLHRAVRRARLAGYNAWRDAAQGGPGATHQSWTEPSRSSATGRYFRT